MAKKPGRAGKEWSSQDVTALKKLARGDTPTPLIAYRLQRTESGVRNKASEEHISLDPINRSPYNRHKKS